MRDEEKVKNSIDEADVFKVLALAHCIKEVGVGNRKRRFEER